MKRLLVLLVVVAAVVAVTAFYVPANAASVNGSGIAQGTLNADLSAIGGSPGYQCYLGADQVLTQVNAPPIFPVYGVAGSSTGPATYNTVFVRYWLSQLMSDKLVQQIVAAKHLVVTPADLALGRVTLGEQIAGVLNNYASTQGGTCGTTASAILSSLPASFRNEQIQVQAEQDVLLAHESGYGLGTAALNRYFTAHRTDFNTICLSYVLFSTKGAATAARATIETGTPFAQTGKVTPIGCAMRYAITSLPSSVTSLPTKKVSQPVAGGSGNYALFEITSSTPSTFVGARVGVENSVLNAGSARTTALLQAANRRAQVTADPRYGRVAPGSVALLLPKSPASTDLLNPNANLPAPPASAGSSGSTSGAG